MTDHQGHLFIVQGDLTKLSCDGILVPYDGVNVSRWWFDMFEQEPKTDGPYEPLPSTATLRQSRKGPIAHELVDTVSVGGDIDRLVAAVQDGLAALAHKVGDRAGAGRVLPLLALPMPGTGHGGLDHRRGEVVRALVPRLVQSARELSVDLVLVDRDRQDFAALQSAREPASPDLSAELVREADRLGQLAAGGHLSIFVGAGVSAPLGLPTWEMFVNALLDEAGLRHIPADADEPTLLHAATRAKGALGERYGHVVSDLLEVRHHALGHALVASLRARQNVTTNLDRALELAMHTTHGDALKVLTPEWAGEGAPWLLKLHGTAGDSEIVLTEDEYKSHREENGKPLYALVQGLLMTSHLLFVGFSLTDSNYLDLADPVAKLYARSGGRDKVATALGLKSLANQERVLDEAFAHVSFGEEDRGREAAGRTLEIFLDRVVWRASRLREEAHAYLMDDRYEDLVREQEQWPLKKALKDLQTAVAGIRGPGADRVREQLREFGARETSGG
ncbi:SIR2 family protein [Ornithinimicrobium cerasi]|uniref:SIR2-like domain-containing protein n=1 Tax=Ornithinimicrobium cerasi TaxID=2248773 RepID=A0A285VE88_9MICO|nr:SIR2 family protein [Ornithinimicrobium cerasi]SOC52323.1 SIR2-like domain-containing protein [Ornithinimicrobium cerasi]